MDIDTKSRVTKIVFRPGVYRESTNFGNEAGWYKCNLIRWREGEPEKIGGWAKVDSDADSFVGIARSMHPWVALDGDDLNAIGTHLKLYVETVGTYYDITPLRDTESLGADPIATTSGSSVITITDVAHGAVTGDYVTISGATTTNGVADTAINAEHVLTRIDADSYTVDTGDTASSTGTGGGGSVVAAYQINIGAESIESGNGYGTGTYGTGAYGGSSSSSVITARPRIWSMDNFGEDLLACVREGAVYYWDKSGGLAARAVALSDLAGASDVPTVASEILVSTQDRHAIAFGCNALGSATQDKLLIRWCDAEDITNWTPDTDNTAGDLRLDSGSYIVAAVKTRNEIIVFTDRSLHSLRFSGPPYIFSQQVVSDQTSIMGPLAAVAVDDVVFWMGLRSFYIYDGRAQPLACGLQDHVFTDINRLQADKVVCGVNSMFHEIMWFYPSAASDECDRYIKYNYREKLWDYGELARTAWSNATTRIYPMGAGTDGHIYFHDYGLDDGSMTPAAALPSYIESAMFDLDDGDHFMFVRKALPDITFVGSSAASPSVSYTFKTRRNPGSTVLSSSTHTVTRSGTSPDESFTNVIHLRKRGRHMMVRIASNATGVRWRAGHLRLDMRPDGKA